MIKKLFIYLINIPLYWISKAIPKNENIWIFGSWFGDKYADNSKALYEYITENKLQIKTIWLTKSSSVLDYLTKKGCRVYYTYSLKGYYYSIKAKYIFVSTGMNDINRYVSTSNCKVQLWHGIPLKKIQDDVNKRNSSKLSNMKKAIFPFNNSKYQYLISTSSEVTKTFETAFGNVEKILTTGYPRNDILVNNKEKVNTVVFLPTHRGEGKGDIDTIFSSFDINFIEKKLASMNLQLIVKLHFYDLERISYEDTSHIKFLKGEVDIYHLLSTAKILITDYSSIYFDFLLTEEPIIFTPFDLSEYLSKDRELYYDYNKVTPGPKCQNWNEVLDWVDKFKNDSSHYAKERKLMKEKFHKYQDNGSCERVYRMIKENCNA